MGDLGIYPVLIPWALLVIVFIAMRAIGYVHGNRLPFFYFASTQSARLSSDHLHRYRALRSSGAKLGVMTILIGYAITIAIDAPLALATVSSTVGIMMIVSSAFYLEYCMATGQISAPISV